MRAPTVAALINAEARRIRGTTRAAALCLALLALPAALVFGFALAGSSAWQQPSATPLLLEIALVVYAAAIALAVRNYLRMRAEDAHVAAATEARLDLASGSVRGLLELERGVQAGSSRAMYQRAERTLASLLAAAPRGALGGALRERAMNHRTRTVAALATLVGVVTALGFAAPQRARDAWTPLLHPVAHLSPPPLPALIVEPGDAQVARGSAFEVRVQAAGRTAVALRWRATGEVSQRAGLDVRHGVARGRIASVDAPLVYWIEAPDGAVTDSFRVTPVDPLLVSELTIEVQYPAYLGRSAERFAGEVPLLELPEGSVLQIQGSVSRPITAAALRRMDGETQVPLHADGTAFRARWAPQSSGLYSWHLTAGAGVQLLNPPPHLEITVIRDAAPSVVITEPAADGVFSPDLRQMVLADARDDHGIRSAALVTWRVSSLGERDTPAERAIPLDGSGEYFLLRSLIDATGGRMLPGDTLYYFVRAVDNSPRAQVGVSRTMSLRIPGMDEIREEAQRAAEALVDDAAAASRAAQQLATDTRDLARKSQAGARAGASSGNRSGSESGGDMQFRDAERARQIVAEQDKLIAQVEEMRARAEALQDAMQQAGLEDADLRERMNELAALYDQILTSELRQKLEALRTALQELDPRQVQAALEQLAQNQEQFRKQLDQTMELMRRAAAEQQMNELAQRARELAAQQQALAEEMRNPATAKATDTNNTAEQQRDLAEQADSLRAQIEKLRDELKKQGETRAAEQSDDARDKVEDAQKQMEDAAERGDRDTEPVPEKDKKSDGEDEEEQGKTLSIPKLPQLPLPKLSIGKQESQGGSGTQPQPGSSGSAAQAGKQDDKGEAQKNGASKSEGSKAGEQQGGEKQSRKEQGSAQQRGEQAGGGQQSGSEQSGEQQGGKNGGSQAAGQPAQSAGAAAANLEQAARTLESARQAMAEGWKQETTEAVKQSTSEALSLAQRQQALAQQMQQMRQESGGASEAEMQAMRGEQNALKQGLDAMGQNLSDAGRRSAMVDRGVGAALGRSMLSMQQTLDALEGANGAQRLPVEEAAQTVEALNRLALALLQNQAQIEQSASGTGMQEALERLAELAQQQGQLSGQSSSLLPMGMSPQSLGAQLQQMARQQQDIARRLGGMNNMLGGQEDVLGSLDELAREAAQIARDLEGGRLTPETVRRQERLFHRLLDAGRTLERDETSEERVARRAAGIAPSHGRALDPALLEGSQRYPAPTAEQLRGLSPAYRKLILDYFDRLNRAER